MATWNFLHVARCNRITYFARDVTYRSTLRKLLTAVNIIPKVNKRSLVIYE
jgi:hypothetical protein